MSKKPIIGLNADYRPLQKAGPALTYIPAGYYNCIQAAGGIPMILPPMENEDDIAAALDRLDGFVLVGGGDLDPRRDGYQLHSSVKLMDGRREDFDRMLVKAIADRHLPVFGRARALGLFQFHSSINDVGEIAI